MRGKKNLFYSLLVIGLVWMFQPEAVLAGGGTIKVDGKTEDFNVSCGEGTAKYDSAAKTLTLEDAVIGPDSGGSPLVNGISIEEEGVTIELLGDNSIDAYIGIWSPNPIRISGKGAERASLSIRASKNQDINIVPSCGIRVDEGGLTVQDADLRITLDELGDVNGYAIYICGGDNLISNSNIAITLPQGSDTEDPKTTGINAADALSLTIANGSNVTMNSADAGISVGGKLDISGSGLVIDRANQYAVICGNMKISEKSDIDVSSTKLYSMWSGNGIVISDSVVRAESENHNGISCAELQVTNASEVIAKGYWPAFFVREKTAISGSTVYAQATADVGIYSPDGDIGITGSKVEAVSDVGWGGILTNKNLTLTDSNVISKGESGSNAIRAKGDITIEGGTTEIGSGKIVSGNNITVDGTVTSGGVPSYDNIISNNPDGILTFMEADYSEVDAAIKETEGLKKEDYLNFEEVEHAVDAVVRGKDIREQDVVDGYAAAIREAVKALKPIPKPVPPTQIQIVEGADQTVEKDGTSGVTIKTDGDYNEFTGVWVDGQEIGRDQYTAEAGSTVITLKPAYIETLTAGSHVITIRFVNGEAETGLTVKEKTTEPDTEEPGPTEPDPDEPGTDKPDPDEPGTDKPDPDEPGTDKPDPDEPGTDKPGPEEPDPDKPGPEDPDPDKPDPDEPGTDKPDPDEPGTDKPDPDEPGTDKPDPDEPGPDEPDTEKPGTEKPDPDKPGSTDTEKPDKPEAPGEKPGDASNSGQPQKPSDPSNGQVQNNQARAPLTGDHAPVEAWLFLMLASCAGIVAARRYAVTAQRSL
ncbi:hypothetical protein IMSAGC020_00337 [Lachnospiraceae bacterium]|nr:hypothetical protein IMSAGC020_00337 [Lachnospiraceae bacterium]